MCRIIFFGSGDFPIPTFKYLINHNYDIVGLVTSNDKVIFNNERLYDIAKNNNIPTYIPNDLNDLDFVKWLKDRKPDIFCVISYKILPISIINIPLIGSFNVHASLLPFLKGSCPIFWAIDNNFSTTGLTSFLLDEKVDCGDIILNTIVDIDDNETYGSLHAKLSDACCKFTERTIQILSANDAGSLILFKQPLYDGYEFRNAPKLKADNKKLEYNIFYSDIDDTYRRIRALTPHIGVNCVFHIMSLNDEEGIKIPFKIYEAELINVKPSWDYDVYGCFEQKTIMSDGKTYLYFTSEMSDNQVISIKTIQLIGKKKMNIADFLNGFRYFRKENQKKYYIEVE